MRRAYDDDREVCGRCKWHKKDLKALVSDYYCDNQRSWYCGELTEYLDTCDHFEDRSTGEACQDFQDD